MPGTTIVNEWFHHPRFSAKIWRRRVTEELLDLFIEQTALLSSLASINKRWSDWLPSVSEQMAVWRLGKAGLIVRDGGPEKPVVIRVSKKRSHGEEENPEALWSQPWKGVWFVMSYDVPEEDRATRNQFRRFLGRLRMGLLHKSVWIGPRDIRGEYDDLLRTTALGFHIQLLECRTVRRGDDARFVQSAWNWDLIREGHEWYLETVKAIAPVLSDPGRPVHDWIRLAREEWSAYLFVMRHDPLLPAALWPPGYLGRRVFKAHAGVARRLRARLQAAL